MFRASRICFTQRSRSFFTRAVDKAKSDPGKLIMNVGAIASLSGFMMSDVMHLRALSILGSACGMCYNFTRKPRQINALLWGLVFASVNVYHLYWLYQERSDITLMFSADGIYCIPNSTLSLSLSFSLSFYHLSAN